MDEKLDEIEQIMALYEAKLESVPEEYFEDVEFLPPAQEQEVVARTENPLLQIQQPVNNVLKIEPQPAGGAAAKTEAKPEEKGHGFVPPPPENGPKIIAPIGMPAVKTFPISKSAPPAGMSFPNLGSGSGQAAQPAGQPID